MAEVRGTKAQGHPEEFETITSSRGGEYKGMRVHSIRIPGYVASQEVIFGTLGQTLTIRHDSISRESFMPGIMMACKKVNSLKKGLVYGLEKIM
jgi:4-hydroxy-tetrahydrodipicolinate reductase